jgi:hypothetical protein
MGPYGTYLADLPITMCAIYDLKCEAVDFPAKIDGPMRPHLIKIIEQPYLKYNPVDTTKIPHILFM